MADTCAFATSPVRIGRNPLSDLQLDDGFVSQWHAVIGFDEERTTYLDLGATNPTLIDGQPIPRNVPIEVTDNTDIRIGSLRLHVLRAPAEPELFRPRRKTAFARVSGLTGAVRASRPPPTAASLSATGVVARERSAPRPSGELPIYQPAGEHSMAEALHREYERARSLLVEELCQQLEAAPKGERDALCEELFQRFPELTQEPALRDVLGKLSVAAWRTGVPDTTDWLRRLTGGLYPAPGDHTAINPALALERVGEVLEVWSSAFIELRSAHAQLCEDMALDKPQGDSLLYATDDPKALLAYLLNPDTTHSNKLSELARSMADFAAQPAALVTAVVEGARDMLQALSPAMLTGLTGRGERPPASFFGKLLGGEQRELWTRYLTIFDHITNADRFKRQLFGRGFARTYCAIMGRRSLPWPAPVDEG